MLSATKTLLVFAFVTLAILSAAAQDPTSCSNRVPNCDPAADYFPTKVSFDYAGSVKSVKYMNTYVVVDMAWTAWSGAHTQTLVMVRCGCPAPPSSAVPTGAKTFYVPIQRMLLHETVAVPKVYLIGQRAKLSAIDSVQYVTTSELIEDVKNGVVQDIKGNYSRLNVMPNVLLTGSGKMPGWGQSGWDAATMEPIRILDSDAGETTPLGRAEQLKLVALLTGAEDAGNTIFSLIAARYNEARIAATSAVRRRPVVMLGTPSPGWGWSATKGSSYVGRYMADAGAVYRNFADDVNAAILPATTMNMTMALKYFASADYWVNAYFQQKDNAPFTMEKMIDGNRSSTALGDKDAFSQFQAFQCNQVVSNANALKAGLPGNPFFEMGVVRPDLILLDLVYFLHPYLRQESALFANYQPTFYNQLAPLGDRTGIPACPDSRLPATPAAGSSLLQRNFAIERASVFDFRDALYPTIADKVSAAFAIDRASVDFTIMNYTQQSFVLEIAILSSTCSACGGSGACDIGKAKQLDNFAPLLQSIIANANSVLAGAAVYASGSQGSLRCASAENVPFRDVPGFAPCLEGAGSGSENAASTLFSGGGRVVGLALGAFFVSVML